MTDYELVRLIRRERILSMMEHLLNAHEQDAVDKLQELIQRVENIETEHEAYV
jgi:hypothetical protein